MKVKDIREKAWKIHKSDTNFRTCDVKGINTLVDIAIKQTLIEVGSAFKVLSDTTPTHAPSLIGNFKEWINNSFDKFEDAIVLNQDCVEDVA